MASLQSYNSGEPDTTAYSRFFQANTELKNASYNSLNMFTAVKMKYYNDNASRGDTVRLGVLNFSFNLINPDADTNIVYYPQNYLVNGQYSFLLSKTVTMAAAMAEVAYTTNGKVIFKWIDRNNLKNTTKTINYLSIDFNDGTGAHTMQRNSSISITYPYKGNKYLKITTYYTDNTSSTNLAYIYVDGYGFSGIAARRVPDRIPNVSYPIVSEIPFQGYDETSAATANGEVAIFYKSSNGGSIVQPGEKLTKPIILLDGFDPKDKSKIPDIYNELLEYNNNANNFGDEITDAGNDAVVLNFPLYKIGVNPDGSDINRDGGTDYIERNAMVLVKLIQNINQTLVNNGSQEKITIVGPSMGGMIARYALAYMERNSIPHNCKLFVSFDAPHLGANIPIGDQLFLSFAANTLEDAFAKQKFDENLNIPAAKQLLIVHHLGFTGGNINLQGAPNFRERFKQAMAAIGWPSQTRNIGIANGSINGTTTGSAGMNVLDLQYKFKSGFARFFLGKSGLISRIYFTNGYGSSSNIFYYFRRTGFLGSESQTISAGFNGVCSIDAAPGGFYNTQGQIADGLPANKDVQGLSLALQTNNLFRNHCFIPTISALALTNGNPDFCQSLYSRNLVCTNETPFKTYYAPVNKNMKHVTFDNELGSWLKNEFKGINQLPTVNYNAAYPISIFSGTEPICSPVTYKVNNLPAGASVVWSISNQNIATVNSSTGTVTGKATGTVILTAAITACGSTFPTQKTIQVGGPVINISYAPSGPCNGSYQTWSLNASSPNTVTSWQWTVDNPSSGGWVIYSPNSQSTNVAVSGGGGISVTATSSCGTARNGVTIYSNCPRIAAITASPNPTTDNVTIAVAQSKNAVFSKTKKALMYKIKVTDPSGTVKKEYKYSGGVSNTNISLKGLISGMYTIQAYDGASWSSVQVIKQ